MSSELKQAAQQALKELGEARKIIRASSSRQLAKDWDRRATTVLADLRTAIQQAAKSEPVGMLVSDEFDGHRFIPNGDQWPFNEPLYTHPAPGVPDGYALVPIEPTEKMLLAYTGGALTEAGFRWCRHQWSAMLAAAQAQKGGAA